MIAKVFIGLGLALLLVSAQASHLCPTCGLTSGSEACSCTPTIVRPVRPHRIQPAGPRVVCARIPGVDRFKPIGDVCSCGQSIVSPAYVPKQHCSSCQSRLHSQISHDSSHSYAIPAPSGLNNFEPEETGGEYDYLSGSNYGSSSNYIANEYYSPQQPLAPADAVSLTLAYGLAQQAARNVPEERLAFGFRQIPKDSPIQKKIVDIPEERLFTVDRQIVELKPIARPYGCGSASAAAALEQEAAEDLLQQQQDELELQDEGIQAGQAYLSYRDIGYGPESPRNQPSYIVRGGNEVVYDDIGSSNVHCNDGYIPGSVINQNQALEYLEEADVSDAYGSDEDDNIASSPYNIRANSFQDSYISNNNYGSGSYGSNNYESGSYGSNNYDSGSYGSSIYSSGYGSSGYGGSSYGTNAGYSSSYGSSGYGNNGILIGRLSGGCGGN